MAILEDAIETRPCRYGLVSFFKNDTNISRLLREYGEWAQAEIEFLRHLIGPSDTVLDVGGFIGTHTLAFAQKLSEGGKVYAFEPQPTFFEVLRRNIEQNGLVNVTALNIALSDQPGQLEISDFDVCNAGNFGGTALLQSSPAASSPVARRAVDVMTIDQLPIQGCDLIKIDAEGMETKILKGAQQTLRTARPIVFAECNSLEAGWPIVELLKNQGYATYLLNVQAYNPHNFRKNENTFLGDARETSLVLIPQERLGVIQGHLDPTRYPLLVPISCIDDLALGLLKKPQYKYEVMARTAAASVLGVDFWSNETETRQLQETVQYQERALVRNAEEITALKKEQEALLRQREENEREHARNLAAHAAVIGQQEERIAELEGQRAELEGQCAELEGQCAAQKTELEWLYRWIPVNKLARKLLFGRNLRRRLMAHLRFP